MYDDEIEHSEDSEGWLALGTQYASTTMLLISRNTWDEKRYKIITIIQGNS